MYHYLSFPFYGGRGELRVLVIHDGELRMDGAPREIFEREEELNEFGLAIPKVTSVLRKLKKLGIDIDTSAITVKEAKEAIINSSSKRMG